MPLCLVREVPDVPVPGVDHAHTYMGWRISGQGGTAAHVGVSECGSYSYLYKLAHQWKECTAAHVGVGECGSGGVILYCTWAGVPAKAAGSHTCESA